MLVGGEGFDGDFDFDGIGINSLVFDREVGCDEVAGSAAIAKKIGRRFT